MLKTNQTVSNRIDTWVRTSHAWLAHGTLHVLALMMGLVTAGLVLWDPVSFAKAIGGFGPVVSPALIWSCCTAIIFGVGFVPRRWYWQLFFTPYAALPILAGILWLRLS
ncbi:cyd operon YbgE family protein [Photobacterium sp. TLY01]|uniref:cyd operon YbgE family protein n=1 Tax=Photobacterium sp. TLY01 TaxID=2907534 RepID=UPI001F489B28|nr:cyd operon YbgE family protein [Photobacterium sp. TLY01]UIP26977.1 cytochrome bd biosynthesis protein [Photobacterium sp. TLY01]